jgi:regulator of RNase E activity RraA
VVSTGARQWAEFGTCLVSDATDRLGFASAVPGLRPLSLPRTVAGRAVTVQLGPANGQVATRHLCTAAVDAAGPGDVIVIATAGRVDAASWGGLLSLGAVQRGVEGVVIDGACRDVDEAVDLGLPVFARAPVPTTARGRIMELAWNVPVRLGEREVTPGDIVVADRSGVVFVPQGRAGEVAAQAVLLAQREQHIAGAIRRGQPMAAAMGATYETLRGDQ